MVVKIEGFDQKLRGLDVLISVGDNEFKTATLTAYNKLIMLHSAGICAEWQLDKIGVQLSRQDEMIIKLAFINLPGGYQSFYLKASFFDEIERFFKRLGFPMPKDDNVT